MRALIITFALIAIAYSLCIDNGKRYKENEKWNDGETRVKQCKKGKHGWKPEVVECIIEKGFKVPRNAYVEKDGEICYCEDLLGDGDIYPFCVK